MPLENSLPRPAADVRPTNSSAWFFALALVLAGCGGGHPATVGGTVMLDGKPLTTGNVTFFSPATGITAYGSIQPNGRYTLQTGSDHGLPVGEYTVTVVATEPVSTPTDPRESPVPPKLITPPKYNDPALSGLKFTIKTGSNGIDLSLNSKVPEAR